MTVVQLPDDYMPEWAKFLVATVLGAGGVRWLQVYLENRRLTKREFRETLLERIRELESVVASLQTRMGNLRVEMAHLEVENKHLKRTLAKLAPEEADVEDVQAGGRDDEPAE